MHSLNLFGRPTRGQPHIENITRIAKKWTRSTRATGGYWAGQFAISGQDVGRNGLTDFFFKRIGSVIKETVGGMPSWEGYIAEMRLISDGIEYMITLDPQFCHNRVRVLYTFPNSVDSNQGALTYDPNLPPDFSFQDVGQDFSEWQTLAGDAKYRIVVTNADGTKNWGFLAEAFQTTNPEDSIVVHDKLDLTDDDWEGPDRFDLAAQKTPVSYVIEDIERSGTRQDTGWSGNPDSSDEYGTIEYIETMGEIPTEVATVLQARHLTEYGFPRSKPVGSITPGQEGSEDQLIVMLNGFWHTANWVYTDSNTMDSCSDLMATLAGLTEFVVAGRIEYNGLAFKVEAARHPRLVGDIMANVISFGDADGGLWKGGVYDDKALEYEPSPTTVDYSIRNNQLVNRVGSPVLPPLLRPGFLVRVTDAFLGGVPISGSTGDDPQVAYVNEVTFTAPDILTLRLFGGAESILTLRAQARGK